MVVQVEMSLFSGAAVVARNKDFYLLRLPASLFFLHFVSDSGEVFFLLLGSDKLNVNCEM